MQDSDAIITHYAVEYDINPAVLLVFQAYSVSVLPRYLALRRESRECTQA